MWKMWTRIISSRHFTSVWHLNGPNKAKSKIPSELIQKWNQYTVLPYVTRKWNLFHRDSPSKTEQNEFQDPLYCYQGYFTWSHDSQDSTAEVNSCKMCEVYQVHNHFTQPPKTWHVYTIVCNTCTRMNNQMNMFFPLSKRQNLWLHVFFSAVMVDFDCSMYKWRQQLTAAWHTHVTWLEVRLPTRD